MFTNLVAEMAKKNLTKMDFARNDKLKLSYTTLRNKFSEKTDWTRNEMFTIQESYFPDKTIEYLFQK